MLIAVVSDTHGHVPYTTEAVRALQEYSPALVLHCGDIGSAAIVRLFDDWPTHFVFGNVDQDETALRRAIDAAGQICHDRFGCVEAEGKRIAFLHGDDGERFAAAIASGEWDLICYGHTHVAEHHKEGPTLVLNPGALYRAQPHSFALVDMPSLTVTRIVL
jgi:putative phosphoesterase